MKKNIPLVSLLVYLLVFFPSVAQTGTITLAVGESYTLPAPTHYGATIYSATWSSASTDVSVQNLAGYQAKVTVVNAFTGNVRITCHFAYSWTDSDGYSHTGSNNNYYLIECSNSGGGTGGGGSGNETGVSLDPMSMNVNLNNPYATDYIGACALPVGSSTTFTWTSTNPSVATVNITNENANCSNGIIVAHSTGSCYIKVTTANGYTKQCQVTVNNSSGGGSSGEESGGCFIVNGIAYKKLTSNTCAVTYDDSSGTSPRPTYCDSISIPSQVTYDGTTYSVTKIGDRTFAGCLNLSAVTIPNSITSIGVSAFSGCSALTSVTIPNSVTSIGTSAFSGCSALTSVTIPNSVTSIGTSAFYNCSALTSVTIPNLVTSIGTSAFYNCSALTSVTIPNLVTRIENEAFYGCSALSSVTIPNSVTSIGTSAFSGCSALTSVTIPSSVIIIETYAFYNCSSLTSLTIPSSVTSIGSGSFLNCSALINISVDPSNRYFSSQDGILYNKNKTQLKCCPGGKISVTIPSSVTSIGAYAFYSCTALTSVIIPNSVTSIENHAFDDCSALTSITIPSSVTSLGISSFFNCSALTNINVEGSNQYYSSQDGVLYNKNKTQLICCPGGKISVTIPSSVTSIGTFAFYNCTALTSVTIPNSVTSIGTSAFSGCSALTSVAIPNSVTSIGTYAFSGCTALDSILLYSAIPPSIDYKAFGTNPSSRIFYVPCGMTYSYLNSWKGCYSFTDIWTPYTIEVAVNDSTMGRVEYNLCSNPITLNAIANFGYHFEAWTDGDTINPKNVTLLNDASFGAIFAKNQYELNVISNDTTMGTTSEGNFYAYLDTVTISATSTPHHHFVCWNDGNTSNPRNVIILGDMTKMAIFATDTHSITLAVDDIVHGTTTGGGAYSYGTATTVEGIPYSGYQFSHWSNGSIYNPYTFAVVRDMRLVAYFNAIGEPYQDTLVVHDTIYIYDTIYIHDTMYVSQEGVDDVEASVVKIYQHDGQLVVEGAEGRVTRVYDAVGRLVTVKRKEENGKIVIPVPMSGVYLVKIDDAPAYRVVVIR